MAAKMLKLSLPHCGRAVYLNPLLVTSVCEANPPQDEDGAVPADYTPPKAYVMTTGDMEGIGVRESAADVVAMWEDSLNA